MRIIKKFGTFVVSIQWIYKGQDNVKIVLMRNCFGFTGSEKMLHLNAGSNGLKSYALIRTGWAKQ